MIGKGRGVKIIRNLSIRIKLLTIDNQTVI